MAANHLALPRSSNIVPCPCHCKPTAPGSCSSHPGSVSSLLGTCLPDPGASKSLPASLLAARLQPRLPVPGTCGTLQPSQSTSATVPAPAVSLHRTEGTEQGSQGGLASPWLAAVTLEAADGRGLSPEP